MKRVIALGFFDGVHLGHGALLKRTVEVAKEKDAMPAACTFDVHPLSLVTGEKVGLLTTPARRRQLMQEGWGIREVITLPFDQTMMTLPWDRFVREILAERYGACHLVVGDDHRFGYQGQGTPEKLQALCAQLGLGCDIISRVCLDAQVVSSSLIRSLLEQGETAEAARFLGRPYALEGKVSHGKGLGGKLGFPTVNLAVDPTVLLPAFGVYAAKVRLENGRVHQAVTNIGVRPTVRDGGDVSVESFLLDFTGDLYGQSVTLELYDRLRAERAFASLEELKAQVHVDAQAARVYLPEE